MKNKYGANDYYNSAVYTAASGAISSQKKLRTLYRQTTGEDIKARKAKLADTEKTLKNALAVKSAIVVYTKTGRWKRPYAGCGLKVKGRMLELPGKQKIPLLEYENTRPPWTGGLPD